MFLHYPRIEAFYNPQMQPVHLALGVMDGLHLGHLSVLGSALQGASQQGGQAWLLRFWPPPAWVLGTVPPSLQRQLLPTERMCQRLAALGLTGLIEHPFTTLFAQRPADTLLPWLQEHIPQLTSVHVGENFRYGHGRQGSPAQLIAQAQALGLDVKVLPTVCCPAGLPISSTRIRKLLATHDTPGARTLLNE